MGYDVSRQETVLFGGYRFGVPLGDTWVWNSTSWEPRTPVVSPTARYFHAMAYDTVRHELLLFGGTAATAVTEPSFDDTWGWDGTNWIRHSPAQSPPPRNGHGLAFDEAWAEAVLCGGCQSTEHFHWPLLHDTWVWDGGNWSRRLPATAPPPEDRLWIGIRRFAATSDPIRRFGH